mgnify:CR=1 FL=1
MGIKNIEKKSFFYSLLKVWVDFWHNKVFYRNIEILNFQNIPEKGHLIFTPNHQNALMDALAILCTIKRRSVFLARSDIFKKPTVAAILYFLKILPIYRIRDGYELLKKNKEIFQKTTDVITNEKCTLVILPEGNHAGMRRLRPLKKGFARIAFQTEEANNFGLDIHIVPVGIDYENYQAFRSKLSLNFGKPVPVSNHYEAYKKNPAIAINAIKDELSSQIKPLIVDIETEDYYELFNNARVIYAAATENAGKDSLLFHQHVVKQLQKTLKQTPEKIAGLNEQIYQYMEKTKALNLDFREPVRKMNVFRLFNKSFWLMLFSPIYLYGLLNNILPYQLTKWAAGKIKDPQFKSSFSFVVSLVAFPLFNIIQTLIFMFFVSGWLWVALYFISVPLSGIFAWHYANCFRSNWKNWKIYGLFSRRKQFMVQIQADHRAIIKTLETIVE